jgi:hypothetical protein
MSGLFALNTNRAPNTNPYLPPDQTPPPHGGVGANILTMLDLLTGGYGHAVMAMQRQGEERRQAQALAGIQAQDYGDAASMFKPGAATASAPAPIPDASSGVNLFAGGKYGPPPTQAFGGDSVNVAPAQIPSFEQFAPVAARMASHGADPTAFMNIIKSAEPDIQFVNGTAVDRRATKPGSRVGVNLSNVNNRMVDTQDPGNANITVPQVDKGQIAVYDAKGNPAGVMNLPGSVQAQADVAGGIAGAQERQKARYDLSNVPLGSSGRSRQMSRLDALSALGGGGAAGTSGPAPYGANGDFGVSQSESDKTYQNDTAKAAAATYQKLQDSGHSAPTDIAQYQKLKELFGAYDGNQLSSSGMEISRLAKSLGMNWDKDLPNKEAAVALSRQIALQLRNPESGGGMPGSLSNSDRQFLASMTPNLEQTAAGRQQLADIYITKRTRDQDVAAKARQWQQRFGRLDAPDANGLTFEDGLTQWSAKHPLFGKK